MPGWLIKVINMSLTDLFSLYIYIEDNDQILVEDRKD